MYTLYDLKTERPLITHDGIMIDTAWWKHLSSIKLTNSEMLAAVWYWSEGEKEDKEQMRKSFIKGSRATQWRIKVSLKEKGLLPTELRYVDGTEIR